MGSGAVVAQAHERLEESRLFEFEAGLLAIYWIRKAKNHDPYCGGETRLYALGETGELRKFETLYVQLAEDYFDEFSRLFDSILIPARDFDRDMLEDVLKANIRGEVSDLIRYRRDLIRMYREGGAYLRLWPAPI